MQNYEINVEFSLKNVSLHALTLINKYVMLIFTEIKLDFKQEIKYA